MMAYTFGGVNTDTIFKETCVYRTWEFMFGDWADLLTSARNIYIGITKTLKP